MGVCEQALKPMNSKEECKGKAMVANRTREIRPSGMKTGAKGDAII